jgi:hypothetical protein
MRDYFVMVPGGRCAHCGRLGLTERALLLCCHCTELWLAIEARLDTLRRNYRSLLPPETYARFV